VDEIEQYVRDRLFQEIAKLKGIINSAEARISNGQYCLCAETLQSAGVEFSKFEHEIFSIVDTDRG
jgi:RNA polymerase-binding transcription factor DksA